jgi:hypothetical protein
MSLIEKIKHWLKNRYYEPFFLYNEKVSEVYLRNRQVGGA